VWSADVCGGDEPVDWDVRGEAARGGDEPVGRPPWVVRLCGDRGHAAERGTGERPRPVPFSRPCPTIRSTSRVNASAMRSIRPVPPVAVVAASRSSVALSPRPSSRARSWNAKRLVISTPRPERRLKRPAYGPGVTSYSSPLVVSRSMTRAALRARACFEGARSAVAIAGVPLRMRALNFEMAAPSAGSISPSSRLVMKSGKTRPTLG
jgi:hypothetical protein